jgi:hypothetical protein
MKYNDIQWLLELKTLNMEKWIEEGDLSESKKSRLQVKRLLWFHRLFQLTLISFMLAILLSLILNPLANLLIPTAAQPPSLIPVSMGSASETISLQDEYRFVWVEPMMENGSIDLFVKSVLTFFFPPGARGWIFLLSLGIILLLILSLLYLGEYKRIGRYLGMISGVLVLILSLRSFFILFEQVLFLSTSEDFLLTFQSSPTDIAFTLSVGTMIAIELILCVLWLLGSVLGLYFLSSKLSRLGYSL